MKPFSLALLFFGLGLAGCASNRPIDRTDSQKEYEKQEAVNQEKSMERSEVMTKVKAYDFQISSIDDQIRNQKNLIKKWKGVDGVASSEAMIANANLRINALKKEREELVRQQVEWKDKLTNLH